LIETVFIFYGYYGTPDGTVFEISDHPFSWGGEVEIVGDFGSEGGLIALLLRIIDR
jgi:hypothetical protein